MHTRIAIEDMTAETLNYDHSKISASARALTQFRTYSGTPFSKEIARLAHGEEVLLARYGDNQEPVRYMAPSVEARFRGIDRLLRREIEGGLRNISELAAGLSDRGITFTANPDLVYVESDLEEILAEKRRIIRSITATMGISRPGLFFREANALVYGDLLSSCREFERGSKVAVITEGLLSHLLPEERVLLGRDIRRLANRYELVWLCSDLPPKTEMDRLSSADPIFKATIGTLSKTEGRSFRDNAPDSVSDTANYFEAVGFLPERHPIFYEGVQLASLKHFGITLDEVKVKSPWQYTWLLRPTQK